MGYELPFHSDTSTTSSARVADLSYAWTAFHGAFDGGKIDGSITSMIAADGPANRLLTMGYNDRDGIPFQHALAWLSMAPG